MFKGGAKKNSLDGRTPQSFFFWYNDLLLLIFGLNLHVEKKRTHERHFCFTFASQSALSCKNFLYWRWVTKIHCCVSEFTVTPSIIKEMQTSQHRKSRIWEMKNRCNRVCAIFHMRDIRKSVIPKFINIVESCHVGVPLRVTNMAPGNQQKHLSLSFPSNTWIHHLVVKEWQFP